MSGGYPRTRTALRAALESAGLVPRRRHGQHFLTDPQAVDAIVRDAGVVPSDHVVEVGTGPGLLTHALAETGARVTSFEIDAEILALTRSLATWPARVTFVEGDALASKRDLSPRLVTALRDRPAPPGRLLVVSNLPYGAGTPILLGMLAVPAPPDELVVMLQAEVAAKLLARAGEPEYGAPSVVVGLVAGGKVVRRFGPDVFWPPPRVRSAVLRLAPLEDAPLRPDEQRPFGELVTRLFAHRRKMLRAALELASEGLDRTGAEALLSSVGLDPRQRVETAPPRTLLDLWRRTRAG